MGKKDKQLKKLQKKEEKKQVNNNQSNVLVVRFSDKAMAVLKQDVAELNRQYEIIMAEYKDAINRLHWKESALVLERDRLIKGDGAMSATIFNIRAIEDELTEEGQTTIVSSTVRKKLDVSSDVGFREAEEKVDRACDIAFTILSKYSVYFYKDLIVIYIKFMLLNVRVLEQKNDESSAMSLLQSTYFMCVSLMATGKLKQVDDAVFQQEVSYLFERITHYSRQYKMKISNAQDQIQLALHGCQFASGCTDEAIKLKFYFRLLTVENENKQIMLFHYQGWNSSDLYQYYKNTRDRFFDLIVKKKVNAKAILDFLDVSLMIFILKNTLSQGSLWWKFHDKPLDQLNPVKYPVTDDEFRAHLEMAKKQEEEYLRTAVNLLAQTNLAVVFADMEVCDHLKKSLLNYRTFLLVNIIALYEGMIEKRDKDDSLSLDAKLEIIKFKRLAQLMLDCFQYLEEVRIQDKKVIVDQEVYDKLDLEKAEIQLLKENDFLRKEKVAEQHAQELMKWEDKTKEFEKRRLQEKKAQEELENQRRLEEALKKQQDRLRRADEPEVADEIVMSHPAVSQLGLFMQNAALFLQRHQYTQAATAYGVAKQFAIKTKDVYQQLCALDGLLFVVGTELFRFLDESNSTLEYRLSRKRAMSPDEQQTFQFLLKSAQEKYGQVQTLQQEFSTIANSSDITQRVDIQDGLAYGKQLLDDLLNMAEKKKQQTQEMYVQLDELTQHRRDLRKAQMGPERWCDPEKVTKSIYAQEREMLASVRSLFDEMNKIQQTMCIELGRQDPCSVLRQFSVFVQVSDGRGNVDAMVLDKGTENRASNGQR